MKGSHYFSALFILLSTQLSFAGSGLLFNVTSAGGAPTPVQFSLCMNAYGPTTCQRYTADHLNLDITTVPAHTYTTAGIKLNTPGYTLSGCTMISNGYCIFTTSNTFVAHIGLAQKLNANLPWYPSLQAFEHYNSARSHFFTEAFFGGSFSGSNMVDTLNSPTSYPSGYNMSYLNADLAYIYGGGHGDISGSIGAYVAQVNPTTLESIWYNQLIDTSTNGEWDYPGSLGILNDGYLYVVYGYRLAKLNPATGNVIATLILPTGGGLPENTAFNGFNATADGTLVMKSLYRQAGCGLQGPSALLNCPDPSDVSASILVSVNPKTMQVIDNVTLPALPLGIPPSAAKPTIAQYQNKNYVYLPTDSSAVRYRVQNGVFTLDTSWNPGTITLSGQTSPSSFVGMGDWVVTQTNSLPSAVELSVISINQGDASQQFSIQPFAGDPIPPLVAAAYSTAAPGGAAAVSWTPSSIAGDATSHLVYASDALPGEIAAVQVSQTGLTTVWKVNQATTEGVTLINPQATQVLVGTDIPGVEIPGGNANDFVVWRNAITGSEIARSPLLPAITPGTLVQPSYSGDMLYPGQTGTLIQLSPEPL